MMAAAGTAAGAAAAGLAPVLFAALAGEGAAAVAESGLARWCRDQATRAPDFIVGGQDDPYLRRWWLVPRNDEFNVYLHQFLRDDDDWALHDHPWDSLSIVLSGGYWEATAADPAAPAGEVVWAWRQAGDVIARAAETAHRIALAKTPDGAPREAWTLFLTGPRVREWGFHCPRGWRHWKAFVNPDNPGERGRGCD